MSATDPLYVIAFNYQAYVNWCRRKGYGPHNGSTVYVRGIETLRTLSNVRVLMIEGWDKRYDAKILRARASIVARRPS